VYAIEGMNGNLGIRADEHVDAFNTNARGLLGDQAMPPPLEPEIFGSLFIADRFLAENVILRPQREPGDKSLDRPQGFENPWKYEVEVRSQDRKALGAQQPVGFNGSECDSVPIESAARHHISRSWIPGIVLPK
jgi:hypothetical protein